MPQNLELKARISDHSKAVLIARKMGGKAHGVLHQTDTYFKAAHGRLKLREENAGRAELIGYHRPNVKGARISSYRIMNVERPTELKTLLTDAMGTLQVVRKERRLFLYRNSRIHIDRVEGLGDFLEFEVLVTRGLPQARALYRELQAAFAPVLREVFGGSYSDLLGKSRK